MTKVKDSINVAKRYYRRFRGQEDMSDAQLSELVPDTPVKVDVNKLNDPTMSMLFAPDPATGWPTSSLSLILNDNTPAEIKDYIRNNIRIATPIHDGEDESSIMDGVSSMSRYAQYGQERESNLAGLRELINKYKYESNQ